MRSRLAYSWILRTNFLSCASLLSDDSRLCQVEIKNQPAQIKICSPFHIWWSEEGLAVLLSPAFNSHAKAMFAHQPPKKQGLKAHSPVSGPIVFCETQEEMNKPQPSFLTHGCLCNLLPHTASSDCGNTKGSGDIGQ